MPKVLGQKMRAINPENISTIGSISINDCVCDSPSDYMKIENGEGTCTKCPGIGKIKGIKNDVVDVRTVSKC